MKEKNEIKKYMFLIIFAIITYFAINNLHQVFNILKTTFVVFLPFIMGGIIAFILNIPMTKIEKLINKKIKKESKRTKSIIRAISIILSLAIFLLIVGLVSFMLIPELIESIESLISNLPNLVNSTEKHILNLLESHPEVQVEIKNIFNDINTSKILSNILNYIVSGSLNFISNIISSIITLFMSLVFAIYMLSQKEYLINGFKKVMNAYLKKEKVEKLTNILKLSNKTFSKFISGQCLDAAILGTMLFLILSLFKFPYALIISVLTSITALIPIFGAFIAMIIGTILICINNPFDAFLFILLFLIVQQIEEYFVYPKVVGSSVGLLSLWTLLAITVGGKLFGIPGMIIGLPLASILYSLFRNNVNKRLERNN